MYVTYRLLQSLVLKYVIVCEKTSHRILKDYKIHSKSALYFIYALYFLSTIFFTYFVYLLINGERWAYVAFIVYPLVIIFTGTLLYEFRKELIRKRKIHGLHISEFIQNTYVLNRVQLLFGKTLLVMMVLVGILYVFSSIIVALGEDQVPVHAYFIFLHMIPVFLVLFIYVKVDSDHERNVRKILSYLLLLFLTVLNSYNEFRMLVELEGFDSVYSYLIYIMLTIFTAIERCVQVVYDDYALFKEEVQKTETL